MMIIFTNTKFVRKLRKTAVLAAMAAVMVFTSVVMPGASIKAEAAANMTAPRLKIEYIFSNMASFSVTNLSSYPANTYFRIYVGGIHVKTYTAAYLKSAKYICLTADSKHNFAPNSYYSIRAAAFRGRDHSPISDYTMIKTHADTDYRILANTAVYNYVGGGRMKYAGRTDAVAYVKGVLTNDYGTRIAGRSTAYRGTYLLINDGAYKGKYVAADQRIGRMTQRNAKVSKVVQYAVGMEGGSYVWGGASYRACDCSGLTMLAYRQIGIDITHSTYIQAQKGTANTMSNIREGDVIICNNYGHAALYIGNGKIIHAMNSYYGIRIQDISMLKYCGYVNAVRTIV